MVIFCINLLFHELSEQINERHKSAVDVKYIFSLVSANPMKNTVTNNESLLVATAVVWVFKFCNFLFYSESLSSCVIFYFLLPLFVCFPALCTDACVVPSLSVGSSVSPCQSRDHSSVADVPHLFLNCSTWLHGSFLVFAILFSFLGFFLLPLCCFLFGFWTLVSSIKVAVTSCIFVSFVFIFILTGWKQSKTKAHITPIWVTLAKKGQWLAVAGNSFDLLPLKKI